MKKFKHGTEGFRKKAGGPVVRTRPHTIAFPRTKGPVGATSTITAIASRGEWANRLKGARNTLGRKGALKLKRTARKMTGF